MTDHAGDRDLFLHIGRLEGKIDTLLAVNSDLKERLVQHEGDDTARFSRYENRLLSMERRVWVAVGVTAGAAAAAVEGLQRALGA